MAVYRIQSGLIYDDGFDTLDSRWVVSPSTSYTLGGGQLTLQHNETGETTALFEVPNEPELLFEVHADYVPTKLGDEGGIVVWKSAMEKLEFLESMDTTGSAEYGKWRVTKRGNLWMFFAYRNGAWELFDSSVCIQPVLMGTILKGFPDENYKTMGMDRTILCKGSAITVANVNSDYEVLLLDEEDNIVNRQVVPTGFSGITLELPSIPFKGSIQVYDRDATNEGSVLLHKMEEVVSMYGGDLFMIGTELLVTWKGQELDSFNPTHLGALKDNAIEERMTIANPSSGNIAENITIKIAIYNEHFGWTWADISEDGNGSPLTYSKEVSFPVLFAGEERDFWIKVSRGVAEWSTKPTYFMLDIKND